LFKNHLSELFLTGSDKFKSERAYNYKELKKHARRNIADEPFELRLPNEIWGYVCFEDLSFVIKKNQFERFHCVGDCDHKAESHKALQALFARVEALNTGSQVVVVEKVVEKIVEKVVYKDSPSGGSKANEDDVDEILAQANKQVKDAIRYKAVFERVRDSASKEIAKAKDEASQYKIMYDRLLKIVRKDLPGTWDIYKEKEWREEGSIDTNVVVESCKKDIDSLIGNYDADAEAYKWWKDTLDEELTRCKIDIPES
jgi:dihydroneopterin aldolase